VVAESPVIIHYPTRVDERALKGRNMSLFRWISGQPRRQRICQVAGLALFIVAFSLPACHDTDSGSLVHAARLMGWQCAWLSISLIFDSGTLLSPLFFAFLGGCINPLIVIYVLLGLTKRFAITRKALACAILLCMASTWVFFVVGHFVPLIGHVLWIAGALLILYPEFAALPRPGGNRAVTEPLSNLARE
jgi:hypothetical protein